MLRTLPLVAVLALVGCDPAQPSTDVNQDRVFTRYELRRDRDATRARASFRFGGPSGTQLVLDGSADVSFEGSRLRLVELPANLTFYERELDRDARAGRFVYEDADGVAFENGAEVPPSIDLADGVEISNDQDTDVAFTGPPVRDGETVTLSLFRGGSDARLAVAEQTRAGATSVTVPVASLRGAAPGDVTLALSRSRTRPAAEAPGSGGEVVEVYEAPLRTGRIVD